jgi:hypothetical protein
MTINMIMDHLLHVTGFTLVDITRTGVTHTRGNDTFERDQQRNWETVIQCLGLRTQPLDIQGPLIYETSIDDGTFGEMYLGHHRVWVFTFSVERHGIWQVAEDPLALLHKDFDQVPIVQGLNETAKFILPIFYTDGGIKNIFFRLGRLDLNSV